MKCSAIVSFNSEINKKVIEISTIADQLPGIITVADIRDSKIIYMSPAGLNVLGVTTEESNGLSGDEYYNWFFQRGDEKFITPKMHQLLKENSDGKSISFFHQIKTAVKHWTWYACSMRTLLRDHDSTPFLVITDSFPIETFCHFGTKIQRCLQEDRFVRENSKAFEKLAKRELEVLKLMALGKSSSETAEELFISTGTVETHRKHIKQKLGTNSYYRLCEFARAFDII